MKYYLLLVSLALLLAGVQPQCVQGCAACNTYADCTSCKVGWNWDAQDQQCQPCPEHCQNCTKDPVTSLYACNNCEGIFYRDSMGNCLLCDQHCQSCQGSWDNCTSCSSGYGLSFRANSAGLRCSRNDSCVAENCMRCYSHSDYQCQTCKAGYTNFLGICLDCTFPCKQCDYPFRDIFWNDVVPFIESLKAYQNPNWNNNNNNNSQMNNSYWNNSYWNNHNNYNPPMNDSYWNNSYWNNYNNNHNNYNPPMNDSYWNNSYWNNYNNNWNNPPMNDSYWNNSYWNNYNNNYWNNYNNNYWNNYNNNYNYNYNYNYSSMNSSGYWNNSYGSPSYPYASAPYWRTTSSHHQNQYDLDIFNMSYYSLDDTDIRFVILGKWIYDLNYDSIMAQVNVGNLTMNQAVLAIQQIINELRHLSFETQEDILEVVSHNMQSLLHIYMDTYLLKFSLHSEFMEENVCALCLDGYTFFNSGGNTNRTNLCAICGVNCKECNGDMCLVCHDGYSLTMNHQCVACDYPCSECFDYNPASCLACEAPYNLNFNNQCVQCFTPCKTCSNNDANYCETCFPPYSLYAQNGNCVFCADPNCEVCGGNQTSLCYQCADGFLLQNNVCVLCTANCQRCIENGICANCMDGYGHSNGLCVSCESGCKTCTHAGTICQKCFEGMYVDSNGDCNICPSPCWTCDSPQTCTTYEEGKVQFGTLVVDCRPGCLTCDASSPQLCTSCEEHYFLNGTHCEKCSPSCRQCGSNSSCSDCEYGYALVSGQCQPCGQDCLQCQPLNPSVCQICEYGFSLINGQCLYECEAGCVECDYVDPTICYECDEGYALRNNGKCIKCLTGCSGACDPENITQCLGCKDGFQLLNNTCVRCPTGCEECYAGECTVCRYGYELKEDNNRFVCKEECFLGCDQCNNASTCSQCSQGLMLTGNDCVPNTTYGQSHGFCPLGTIKVNSQCMACSELNCASCDQNQCFECFDGYYANNSQCAQCTAPCEKCVDSRTCLRCADGHFLPVVSKATTDTKKTYGKKCRACHPKCLTCEDKRRICTSCPDTHRLNGTKCVSRYVVVCVYVFDFDYNTFLQEGQMLSLISFFVSLLSVDSDEVLINSVTEGSTQVSVGISSENQDQANQNSQTISNNQDNLPLTVLSSNVGVYYDDKIVQQSTEDTTTQSSSNMGVIIGAAVGAVVIIAVIIFACYKYRTRKNSSLQLGDSDNQIQEEPSQEHAIVIVGKNQVIGEPGMNNMNNIKVMYS